MCLFVCLSVYLSVYLLYLFIVLGYDNKYNLKIHSFFVTTVTLGTLVFHSLLLIACFLKNHCNVSRLELGSAIHRGRHSVSDYHCKQSRRRIAEQESRGLGGIVMAISEYCDNCLTQSFAVL